MAIINGTSGDDVLNGTPVADEITGLSGNDTLSGAGGIDTLIGGAGNDSLTGGAGADLLNGGGGIDTMAGGADNDTYLVDSASDVVTEVGGEGARDTVQSSVTYRLTAHVEHLTLTGSADINGTGNATRNAITGNDGRNILNGAAGDDTLAGGGGNDTMIYDAADRSVNGGAGTDALRISGAGVHLDLTAIADNVIRNVEIIRITGTGDNMLTLGRSDLLALSSTSDVLRLDGNAGDAILVSGGWNFIRQMTLGAETYAEYTNGAARLRVDIDVDRGGITVLDKEIELSSLDGANGFRLAGVGESAASGFSVSGAGDVNGDGFDDVIVGAPLAGLPGAYSGAAYVVFGRASGFSSSVNLASLNGTNGFKLTGVADYDNAGTSVSRAGDVNGDGFDDVIVGAPLAGTQGVYSGAAYVVFGRASGFSSNVNLANLNGANGFKLTGVAGYDYAGSSVSAAGDVNGDGFDDVVVGATLAGTPGAYSGAAYVVFGRAGGFSANVNLENLNGVNGFKLDGVANYDYAGFSVSGAGDVNGDGFDDLLVGAFNASPGGRTYAGASYVVFGAVSGFAATIELSNLNGANGFRLVGAAAYDYAGSFVNAAGDVNGDGFDDVIVGAFNASPGGRTYAGASYVVFGAAGGFTANVALSGLDGGNGFRLVGAAAGDYAGFAVSGAGDVNGDGFDDVIVGAFNASPGGRDYAGDSYVIFGAEGGFAANIALSALNGANGFKLSGVAGDDSAGFAVSAAGDVNGDGFDDLMVGAPYASPNDVGSGTSYVVFGGNFTGAVTHLGANGADSMTGSAAAETFVAGQGNDTVRGGGGADVVRAGAGNDFIFVSGTNFADIDGGSGTDTLHFLADGQVLDLTTLPDDTITGFERIDITGSGDNTLDLGKGELLDLSDSSNRLRVDGNAGDTVNLVGAWSDDGVAAGYHTYTLGAATILIDSDIFVT